VLLAVDSSRRAVLAGDFDGELSLYQLCGLDLSSTGRDIWLARLKPTSGDCDWVKRYGGTDDEWATGLTIGSDNDIIMAGRGRFDPAFGGACSPTGFNHHLFVARFGGQDGSCQKSAFVFEEDWILGTGYLRADAAYDQGTVTLVGDNRGALYFEAGGTASGAPFVATYEVAGGPIEGCSYLGTGGGPFAEAATVRANDSGTVMLAGGYTGELIIPSCTPLPTSTSTDIFVAKLAANGCSCSWSTGLATGAYGDDHFEPDVAIALSGSDVIVAGRLSREVNWNGEVHTPPISGDKTLLFVALLDGSSGQVVWSWSTGDDLYEKVTAIAVDPNNDNSVFLAGTMNGQIEFGGQTLGDDGDNDSDVFVVKFTRSGTQLTHVWSEWFGDDSDQLATSVAVDDDGQLLVAGRYGGELDFGGEHLLNGVYPSVFVAKFVP